MTVVVTNVDTGLAREVPSDASGFYRASALPPGNYTLRADSTDLFPTSERG